MSFGDGKGAQILIRSSSSESRGLKGSMSQMRLGESHTIKANEFPTRNLPQNLTKVNLKNKVLINTYANHSHHKRNISGDVLRVGSTSYQIKATLDLHEQFLKKLVNNGGVENQVSIVVEFLRESGKICPFFSDIFLKVSEIVEEYQKYVKNLDSTRIENQEMLLDIRNSIFKNEGTKMMQYKPTAPKKAFKDLFPQNFSADSHKHPTSIECIFRPKGDKKIRVSSGKSELPKDDKQNLPMRIPGLNLPKGQTLDFHQEFMQKIDEFSESWRAEAKKLKN